MELKKLIIGVSALALMATPTLTTYADSVTSYIPTIIEVIPQMISTSEVYTTGDLNFYYNVYNDGITIKYVTKNASNSGTWGEFPNNGSTDTDIVTIGTSTDETITSIVFPSEIDGKPVTTIGNGSYDVISTTLDGVKSVEIPEGVTTISDYAFKGCNYLEDVSIPDTITQVGTDAFEDTPWLSNQPDGLLYLGKVAYRYLGEPSEPFEVSLKDDTTQIGARCFKDLPVTKVTIPESVTSIGLQAFLDCTTLKEVTILSKDVNANVDVGLYLATIGICTIKDEDSNTSGGFVDGLTIHGYTGSTTEEYVHILEDLKKFNVNLVYLDTPELSGDFNADGVVSTVDLLLLKRKIMGRYKSLNGADINQDGTVNILDFMTLKQSILDN